VSTITQQPAETEAQPTPRRRGVAAILAVVLLAIAAAGCLPEEEQSFLTRTNDLRRSVGVAPLKNHATLNQKAESWAHHMASTGRLQHSTLTAGLGSINWSALGENVGYSSPRNLVYLSIHNAFVASPSHRANLVNRNYTHMGVGVAKDSAGRVWVVEVFARL
jgi:uncharacterized protein YkwD